MKKRFTDSIEWVVRQAAATCHCAEQGVLAASTSSGACTRCGGMRQTKLPLRLKDGARWARDQMQPHKIEPQDWTPQALTQDERDERDRTEP